MASRGPNEGSPKPEVGDTLIVIHDFQARSSDELSLAKGDRVELIERDDEFGDGWFLGRHLVNNNNGLFPEVYTRPAPSNIPTSSFSASKTQTAQQEQAQDSSADTGTKEENGLQQPQNRNPVTLPLNNVKSEPSLVSSEPPVLPALSQLTTQNQDSPVLHETLTVIDEHITDLRSPASNGGLRAIANDSGSEYSSIHPDQRASYIQGEETDEEEEGFHTRDEVESWSPDDVAEYLFTSGVEKHHCEVFRDQEISGEVILGMDQSSLFIKAFDLGSVGRRLKTWHKIKALQDENTPKASPTFGGSHAQESSNRASHIKRPSAASVRELNHSRRHSSSTDFRQAGPATASPAVPVPRIATSGTFPGSETAHKKQPSFDRNWTLGNAYSQPPQRPLSSTGLQDLLSPSGAEAQDSSVDADRGYFSGTEVDGRKRNLLRKRDSNAESRKSSYAEEQRVRSATAMARQSRFGSVGSIAEGGISSAAQKYYGIQSGAHRRTASAASESTMNMPPTNDVPSPTVTKLDTSVSSARSTASPMSSRHQGFNSDWLSSMVNKPIALAGGKGMRAISDNLSLDRSKASTPTDSSNKDFLVDSPARTGSTTPSGGASFDLESPDTAKSPSTPVTQVNKKAGKKGKKETSAYTRGLLKISPKEASKDADYSGWMRKKSSNLMTTWKPRFFVLKGRRLAYYYSEDDDQEKGLIDISFHRVLPADNEKLTGLHATITSLGGQSMPASQNGDDKLEKGDDSIFIFKLVPPRAGLSRAVNFTKPTVHYFAVPNLKQGRLWMAALMKATIDRDDTKPITTTYQQKTISLSKAKQMRHRPPALMNLDEGAEEDAGTARKEASGLGISYDEADSGVSGVDKLAGQKVEEARSNLESEKEKENPQTA
ncbi:budding BOI2 [Fusarium sp. NRRL 52700]|nr:budding BOI2 [Fusarium sp. NRRL 52700]